MIQTWWFYGIIFVVLVLIDIVGLALGWNSLHFIIKPILMPVLALSSLILFNQKSMPKTVIGFVLGALGLATIGDVFLLFDKGNYFYYGLMMFFTSFLLYMAVLESTIRQNSMEENPLSVKRIIIYVLWAVIIPFFIVYFTSLPLNTALYVGIYTWAMFTVLFLAIRCRTLGVHSANYVIMGMLCFMVSNALLAVNHFFNIDFYFRHSLVMLLYCGAEAIIVWGVAGFFNYKGMIK